MTQALCEATIGRRPTMADVAALTGVSISTVSKVVNDRYGVAAPTARRVRAAIERLGYVPDLAATALRGGATHVVGFVADALGRWESDVLRGAAEVAGATGYGLCALVGPAASPPSPRWGVRATTRLTGSMVDGAIVVGDPVGAALADVPVVAVRRPADAWPGTDVTPAVGSDPVEVGRLACAQLLRQLAAA